MLGLYEFLPSSKFIQLLGDLLCDEESNFKGICSNILFLIAGFDKAQLNEVFEYITIYFQSKFNKTIYV